MSAAARTLGGRRLAALAAVAALAAPALVPNASAGAAPRTSLTAIWNDVMCTACHEPLSVAQSPEAYAERAYIEGLIAKGYTKAQIERELVAQYGPAVLARPPAHGFNLTIYVLPPAIMLAGLAVLGVMLPRWRRRAQLAAAAGPAAAPTLDPADERRLEDELSRYGA